MQLIPEHPESVEDAVLATMLVLGRRVRQQLPGDPLDIAAFPVLSMLDRCGPVRHAVLAERIGLDASTVSRRVRALEEQGLVSVTPDDQDARARQVELRPAGRQVLEQLREQRRDLVREAVAPWSAADREHLRGLLDRLNQDLSIHPSHLQETHP